MQEDKNILTRDELWLHLSNVISLRNSQDQVSWLIYGTFWASNTILIVALLSSGNIPTNPIVGIVITSIGFILCIIWLNIQHRAIGHLKRYEHLKFKLEKELLPVQLSSSSKINNEDYNRFVRKGHSARIIMRFSIILCVISWIIGLLFFSYLYR